MVLKEKTEASYKLAACRSISVGNDKQKKEWPGADPIFAATIQITGQNEAVKVNVLVFYNKICFLIY